MIDLSMEENVIKLHNLLKIKAPIGRIQTIVEYIGGSITYNSEITVEDLGRIFKVGNKFQLHIPPGMKDEVEKFYILRLLGYLFLEMGYMLDDAKWKESKYFPCTDRIDELTQARVDYFIYAFLMPRKIYHMRIQQYGLDNRDRTLNLLSKFFYVPKQWVIDRGIDLEYFTFEEIYPEQT